MRPTTPIPNGCEFTLLSLNVKWPSHTNQVKEKSRNSSASESCDQRSKFSLKKIKTPQKDIQNDSYFWRNKTSSVHSGLSENKDWLSNEEIYEKQKKCAESIYLNNKKECKDMSEVMKKNRFLFEDPNVNSSTKNHLEEVRNIFTPIECPIKEQKTNEPLDSSFDQKLKTTLHTNPKQVSSSFLLRQKIEVNSQDKDGLMKTISRNDRFLEGFRSETIAFPQKQITFHRQTARPPALKQSNLTNSPNHQLIFASKENLPCLSSSSNKIESNKNVSEKPFLHITSILPNGETFQNKRVSQMKPQFRFNTLKELNCKSVNSSGGEKTSSNHVSLLASEESFFAAHSKGNENFAKTVKLMTAKNVPFLREEF